MIAGELETHQQRCQGERQGGRTGDITQARSLREACHNGGGGQADDRQHQHRDDQREASRVRAKDVPGIHDSLFCSTMVVEKVRRR